jgi:ketosteroid isomerase-like protein
MNIKREIETVGAVYVGCFKAQDAAGIAALYADDGVHVAPNGPRSDIRQFYGELFKFGFNDQETILRDARLPAADIAIASGEHRISGRAQDGSPIARGGYWTATYKRDETGSWKIVVQTAIPRPRHRPNLLASGSPPLLWPLLIQKRTSGTLRAKAANDPFRTEARTFQYPCLTPL